MKQRKTLESPGFLLESAEAPKIKPGGSSSSNVLNRWVQSLVQDVTLMATRLNALATQSDRLSAGADAQGATMSATLNSLQTQVDAMTVSGRVLVGLHTNRYINEGLSQCNVSSVFGQATLPIRAQTDLLVQQDVYGGAYISPEVELSYAYSSVDEAFQVSQIDALQNWTVDPSAIYMLRDEQIWLVDRPTGARRVFVRLRAPLQFRGLSPNVLDLRAFPYFAPDLQAVLYRRAGDTAWTRADISYVPNWDASDVCYEVGPVRIHLPNEPLVEIAIVLDVLDVPSWGFHSIKLWHTEYEASGKLVIDNEFGPIGSVVLRGKDPASLSGLTVNVTGSRAEIALTSADTSRTPVLTGALMKTSP